MEYWLIDLTKKVICFNFVDLDYILTLELRIIKIIKSYEMFVFKTAKKIIFVLFAILLSNFNALAADFSEERKIAIGKISDGSINEGLNELNELSLNNDAKASYILAIFYLEGKKVSSDQRVAYNYLLKSAGLCYEPALKNIMNLFLLRQGSRFFNPVKAEILINKCKKNNNNILADAKPSKAETSKATINSTSGFSWENVDPGIYFVHYMGSGFAINAQGYFITNQHVIDGCRKVVVNYSNKKGIAKIIAYDKKLDVAVLRVSAPTPYFMPFNNNEIKLGEELISFGYPAPFGLETGPSMQSGTVSNTNLNETKLYFEDGLEIPFKSEGTFTVSIPMAGGVSGGPVINYFGNTRGIAVAGSDFKKHFPNVAGELTLNYVISSDYIVRWLKKNNIEFILREEEKKFSSEELSIYAIRALALIECESQ